MDIRETLKQTVAEILQKDPKEIGPDSQLKIRRLQGSVGSGILDAAIRRRLGIACPEVYSVSTYGELEAAVLGLPRPESTASASQELLAPTAFDAAVPRGVGCGIDIEMVENLPVEDDYWEADFYRTFFSTREIAYCLTRENPRMHFAARWCAKEALKKCDPAYTHLEMNRIEVTLDESGRPSLRIQTESGEQALRVAVSLTHTPLLAAAIVMDLNSVQSSAEVSAEKQDS